MHAENYFIFVFSNEPGIGNGTRQVTKLSALYEKVQEKLDVPMIFVTASKPGPPYSKPYWKMWYVMWNYIIDQNHDRIDKDESFFVGDEAGRKNDTSDVDAEFAQNLGLKFYTPEMYFLDAEKNFDDLPVPVVEEEEFDQDEYMREAMKWEQELRKAKNKTAVMARRPDDYRPKSKEKDYNESSDSDGFLMKDGTRMKDPFDRRQNANVTPLDETGMDDKYATYWQHNLKGNDTMLPEVPFPRDGVNFFGFRRQPWLNNRMRLPPYDKLKELGLIPEHVNESAPFPYNLPKEERDEIVRQHKWVYENDDEEDYQN